MKQDNATTAVNNEQYQHIGDIAKSLDISARTIRYYEELGLIVPRRSDGGFREYSDLEVEKLTTILRLKKLGLSLEEIREMVKLRQCAVDKKSMSALLDNLNKRLHEFESKIDDYREGIKELKDMIKIIDDCSDGCDSTEMIKCEKCLEEQNKEMPSLMKTMLE